MMSFSLQSRLHHWSHSWKCIWRSATPCSGQIATFILISKDFTWVRVVEQQWGEIPSCRTTCFEGENPTPAVPQNRAVNKGHRPTILPSFYGITLTHDYTFIANDCKIKPKGHLTCNCSITQPAKPDVSPHLLPPRDVLWGTSVTQRQKFHTDDMKSVQNWS